MTLKNKNLIKAHQELNKDKILSQTPKRFTFTPTKQLEIRLKEFIQSIQTEYPKFTQNTIMTAILNQICKTNIKKINKINKINKTP